MADQSNGKYYRLKITNGVLGVFSGKIGLLFYGLLVFILSDLNFLPAF